MAIFTLKKLKQVQGQIPFTMLEVDGVCQFEEFISEIESDGNLRKQLKTAMFRMGQVANMKILPREKFRDVTPAKERIKEFELKTPDLRIYLIKEENHIVVMGGKKSTQHEDFKRFRAMKQRYLQSKR